MAIAIFQPMCDSVLRELLLLCYMCTHDGIVGKALGIASVHPHGERLIIFVVITNSSLVLVVVLFVLVLVIMVFHCLI